MDYYRKEVSLPAALVSTVPTPQKMAHRDFLELDCNQFTLPAKANPTPEELPF